MYLSPAAGITVGYHRMLTHRSFRTHKATEYALRRARHDGGPGLGDRLGGRPPQAPRPHRRGGRPAQPARRPRRRHRRRAPRPLARAHRLAALRARPRRLAEVRAGPLRGPRHALDQPALPQPGRARPGDPRARRLPAHRHPARRGHGPALGRPRPRLLRPPRDLERQLDLPLHRDAPIRGRRSLDQRLLARPALARRVLAPQPPRLPPLGGARPAALGARPLRAGDRRRWSGSGSPGTWSASPRSARRRSSPRLRRRANLKPLLSSISGSSQPPLA